ncbi:hypothetical protein [Yoonia sp. BS5-3]|uniref:Type IV pilus biogenesis protein PilP n=1 Tax=Yoonia phaeophyticola TaxID=3137369 RepID=A0ABZ3IE42_9RHOB
MTTNFALSLSFEGIEMLHRVRHGWKRIGTADVEAKDLDAQLATLRARAEALAPEGLRTKLIIPLDQIKYIAIDSTQTTQADIDAVLDGATPYALQELVVDAERFGGRTHIAAVARETLTEAEAFAHAHGFRPVCFAAIPEPFTFQKEVFFGPTSMMEDIMGRGATVEGDRIPVMVVGTRIKSRLLVFDLPEDELPPSDDFDLASALAPHLAAESAPLDPPTPDAAPSEVADPSQAPLPAGAPPLQLTAPLTEDAPAVIDESADDIAAPLLEASSEAPELDFTPSSDVPEDIADPLPEDIAAPANEDAPVAEDAPVEVSQDDVADAEPDAPEFDLAPAEPVAEEIAEVEVEEPAPDLVPSAPVPAPRPPLLDAVISEYHPPAIAAAVVAPVAEEIAAQGQDAPEPDATKTDVAAVAALTAPEIKADPVVAQDPVFFVPPLLDRVIPDVPNGKRKRARKRRHLSTTAPTLAAPMPTLGPPQAPVNRAPEPANTARRPFFIAGAVAASLVLVGAVAWSAFRDTGGSVEGEITQGAAPAETVDVTISEDIASTAPDAEPAPTTQAEAAVPPATVSIVAAAPDIPQIEINGFSVAPDEASATLGLPVPAEPAAPAIPQPETVAAPVDPDGLPSAITAPAEPPAAEAVAETAPVEDVLTEEAVIPEDTAAEADTAPEEIAIAEVGAPVLRGTVLSPADAQAIYDTTGVWQRAPRFVDEPGETTTEGLIVPFSETAAARVAQPQVPPLTDLETDLSFLPPADPPAAEIQFPVDQDGFILATPEGTVTPEGAIVFAGLPDLTIRERPELTAADLERMALLAPAPEGVVVIAGRPDGPLPSLRPEDAALPEVEVTEAPVDADDTALATAEDAEETLSAGGVALSALTGDPSSSLLSTEEPDVRPATRPGSLQPQADPGTPDITAIIAGLAEEDPDLLVDPSTQGVALSLRPETRPQNFASIVASARAAAPPPAPAAAPVQTAAPVAPQNYAPVPGGVARAATQEDVLPLRQINLIGIYGSPSARRALVRLSNGRYVRVEVGSALDGGQVTAIGENALNYVKRGRTVALELPAG